MLFYVTKGGLILSCLKATKELVELCRIDQQKYVLVVRCGNGISTCKIAKMYGCRIMGIDLSRAMVEVSSNRAKKEGLTEVGLDCDREDFMGCVS
ncbi:MAG: hypothetical protein BA873_07895 [Desulfobulbaceae bacterium C00003063]|nr:MAG: hypothetical protein BA873_07895 [Desulfobulbaceae bacterium C00003063]